MKAGSGEDNCGVLEGDMKAQNSWHQELTLHNYSLPSPRSGSPTSGDHVQVEVPVGHVSDVPGMRFFSPKLLRR